MSPASSLVSSKRVKSVSINTVILEVDVLRTLSRLAAGAWVFVAVFKLAAVATTEASSSVWGPEDRDVLQPHRGAGQWGQKGPVSSRDYKVNAVASTAVQGL